MAYLPSSAIAYGQEQMAGGKGKIKPHEVSLFATRDIISPESNPERIRPTAPWWDAVNKGATDVASTVGQDDGRLFDELTSQASNELALGGELSADEVREATQGERAAWQARGLSNSAPAAFSEVLKRMQYSNARKAERRAFAGGVAGLGLQRREANRNALATLTGASLGPAALAEEQRQYELQRSDSLRTADKQAALDLKIGRDNKSAAESAGKKSMWGSVLGAVGMAAVLF